MGQLLLGFAGIAAGEVVVLSAYGIHEGWFTPRYWRERSEQRRIRAWVCAEVQRVLAEETTHG